MNQFNVDSDFLYFELQTEILNTSSGQEIVWSSFVPAAFHLNRSPRTMDRQQSAL